MGLRTLAEQSWNVVTSQGCGDIAWGGSGCGKMPSKKAAWVNKHSLLSCEPVTRKRAAARCVVPRWFVLWLWFNRVFVFVELCIMAPKHDLAGKTDPAAKKSSRKTITIEQKVDITRQYERGESMNAIRLALGLPESTLRVKRSHPSI